MKEQELIIIIINENGIISNTIIEEENNKSAHLLALELTTLGNIIITNQQNTFHKNNISIYLPSTITSEQQNYIEYINSIIKNYNHITIYNDIEINDKVYNSRVLSSNIENYNILDNYLINKDKIKKKTK